MTIQLTPELDQWIAAQIASGRYSSTSEVLVEALSLLESRDRSQAEQLLKFKCELDKRIEELDRGEWIEPEEVWEELALRSKQMRSRETKKGA